MSITKHEIRPGAYYDSVVLMQLQRALVALDGVEDAGVVMSTPTNLALLSESGLLPAEARLAKPDDLIIVIRAESEAEASAAISQVDDLLARRQSTQSEFQPRSLESAAKTLPHARWALVSVPGRHAAGVARNALDLNLHVFLYSDNVSLEDEVELKKTAGARGLLVMGPDCGTAVINGIGLGFANRTRRGSIGLVGASGTGLQAVSATIHNLGGGISHAIGTGTRDLTKEVGAITALQGLELLARDDETEVIVLVSKPPEAQVAARLLAAAQNAGKPIVVDFIGFPPPARTLGNISFATNLSEAAEIALKLSNQEPRAIEYEPPQYATPDTHHATRTTQFAARNSQSTNRDPQFANQYVRGLFSGGTLAYETMLGLQACLAPLYSNVPIHETQRLPDPTQSRAHTIVDMGADEFTVGRLHPMIDNETRLRRLRQEAEDPEVGLILLDVVLGEGAHPDPAAELAPAIAAIKEDQEIEVMVILIGTEEDPQDSARQAEQLEAAGARIYRGPMEAVAEINRLFGRSVAGPPAPVSLEVLREPLAAINVGLDSFYESLKSQGAEAVQVAWKPPAGGNEQLLAILSKMKGNYSSGSESDAD